MARPSENLDEDPITRANVAVALFWTLLGAIGFIIAASLGVSVFGFIGPAAALGYGLYDCNRLRLRYLRSRTS